MKKRILAVLMATVMVLSMAACGAAKEPAPEAAAPEEAAPEEAATPEGGIKIGASFYSLAFEYFQTMAAGVEEEAKAQGVELIIHDQNNDENELLTGAMNLLDQGIDALVISPCKPEVMGNIVDAAHAKDIPVIILDIGDGGSDKDAIVVSDMFGGGTIGGQYAVHLLEEAGTTGKEYAIIKCEESAVYAIQRGPGFESILDAAGYTKAAEITANSDQTEGYNAMQDILASNPDVVTVFAENDNMALGAASAIDEAGKKGEIVVIGFNGDEAALEAIKDGTMQGTVAQQPFEIGRLGITLSLERIAGNELEFDNPEKKEIFAEVYLIDSTGERNDNFTVKN